MAARDLTAERLRELLAYDPETGIFVWRIDRNFGAFAGDIAGSKHTKGHIKIRIDGKKYFAHRLAWLYMTGEWPKHQVDHKFGDPADNRWSMLRELTNLENIRNQRRARPKNTTGLLGVSRTGKRFAARLHINGKQIELGRFDTPEAAHECYVAAKRIHHPSTTL